MVLKSNQDNVTQVFTNDKVTFGQDRMNFRVGHRLKARIISNGYGLN